jgi:hypothetical protein
MTWMTNLKRFGGKNSWAATKVLPRHSPGWTAENYENAQDSRSPGRDLNPGPPEYDVRLVVGSGDTIMHPIIIMHNTKCIKLTIVFSELDRYRFIVTHGAILQ